MGWVACKDGSWAVNGGGLDAEALPWLRKCLAGSIKLHTAHLSRFRSRKSDGGAFFYGRFAGVATAVAGTWRGLIVLRFV